MKRLLMAITIAFGLLALACHPRPSRVVFGIGMTPNTHNAVKMAAQETRQTSRHSSKD